MNEIKIYYCPASDEIFEVVFLTNTSAIYGSSLYGYAFISMEQLEHNMVYIGEL